MQSLLLDIAIVSILFSAIITAFIYVLSITLKKYLHKYPGNDYIKVKKTQLSKILCTGKVFFYFFAGLCLLQLFPYIIIGNGRFYEDFFKIFHYYITYPFSLMSTHIASSPHYQFEQSVFLTIYIA